MVWVDACIPLAVELYSFFPHPGFAVKPHCVFFIVSESGCGDGALQMLRCQQGSVCWPHVLLLHPGPEPPAGAPAGDRPPARGSGALQVPPFLRLQGNG